MNIAKCLNCGAEFPLVKTFMDDKGLFTICPECGESFDTDLEVELSDAQAERCDEVYEAVMQMCRTLTEDEGLEWNMSFLGEIADVAASVLARTGDRVHFPSVVTEDDESQHIEEYVEADQAACGQQ